MTKEDIINELNPDMFRCPINNEWVSIKDNICEWENIKLKSLNAKTSSDFWKCLRYCSKFINNTSNTVQEISGLINKETRITDDSR